MSIQQVAAVLEHSRSHGGARLVLIAIANHDGDGGSWPTIETIGREANLTENSVHAAISKLQEIGELKVHRNAGGTRDCAADRRPNRYEVFPNGVQETGTPRGTSCLGDGVQETGTQTVLEPSKEPSTRDQVAQWFDEWYAIYPRKKARQAALKAYRSCLKSQRDSRGELVSLEDARRKLLTRVKRFEILSRGRDPQFLPYPASWLNGGHYDDEELLRDRWDGERPLRSTNGQYDTERPVYV